MSRPETVSARVNESERLRVETAAGLRGVSRSAFLRRAALREADRELEAAREELQRVRGRNFDKSDS